MPKETQNSTSKSGVPEEQSPLQPVMSALDNMDYQDALELLSGLLEENPDFAIPNSVKKVIAKNGESLIREYFDKTSVFEPNHPLVQSLEWYCQQPLQKGELNTPHALLASIYSDPEEIHMLAKVNQHLRACSFMNIELMEWVSNDVKETVDEMDDIDDMSPEAFQNIQDNLLEFLILSTTEQRFDYDKSEDVDIDVEAGKDYIQERRESIAGFYFENKTTKFSEQDWTLLGDRNILKSLPNTQEICSKAVIEAKKDNPNYYQDKRKWMGVILSDQKDEISKLNAYIRTKSPEDMAYLARLHYQAKKENLDDHQKYHSKEYTKLLRCSAIRGDKYALGKLKDFKHTTASKNESVFELRQNIEDIEKHLSLLQAAKNAKGIYRTHYLGFGTKANIDRKMQELEMAKSQIINMSDDWISNGSKPEDYPVIQNMSQGLVNHANQEFKKNKNRVRTGRIITGVLSLGFIPLRGFIKGKIAHKLMESATIKSSGYQYWDQHYYAAVDAMDDMTKGCNTLEKSEKKALKEAKRKVKLAKKDVRKKQKAADVEASTFLGRIGLKTKAKKDLVKAKSDLANAQKLEYRADRNKSSIVDNSYLSDEFPGLEIEERTILTKDGKRLDVLVINNKHAQAKDPDDVKDIVHFSGRGCFYKLDDRHFEHAVAKGCNLIVVQDRLTSSKSYASTATQKTMAEDGVAAVEEVIRIRQEEAKTRGSTYNPEDSLLLNGYCGGGPISVLTQEAMQKQSNYKLKFIGDRTFRSLSGMLEGWFDGDKPAEKAKRYATQLFAKPLLKLVGWDVNVAKKISKMPEDQKIYVDINAPNDEKDLYYDDETILTQASIHTGLEKQRKKKLKKLDHYESTISQFKAQVLSDNFVGSKQDQEMILQGIDNLLKTIEYTRNSFDITQVKAKEDDAHVDFTSNFVLRDNTPHDQRLYEFIHNPTEKDRELFAPSFTHDGDPLKADIEQLWLESGAIFNDFYDNGKQKAELNQADFDIRYRINALVYLMNTTQFHNQNQAKMPELDVKQKSQRDFYSPEIPREKPKQKKQRRSPITFAQDQAKKAKQTLKKQTSSISEEVHKRIDKPSRSSKK